MAPTVYYNNAATSWPKAPGTALAVAGHIDAIPLHPGRSGFDAPDPEGDCRSRLAKLLRVEDASRIILAANATHALNVALHGFPWKEKAVVLTTLAEHNSVLRPLHFLQRHRGLRVAYAQGDGAGRIDLRHWEAALQEYRPQLAVFTHASNVTGAINPVEEMCALAHAAGAATLVDASQTAGCTAVLPQAWGTDMLAFTGHKYLLGPPGTGGLYVAHGVDLEPVLVGGTGILSELDEMPPQLPVRYEAGTPNSPAFAGLAHALVWLEDHPFPAGEVEGRLEKLREGLALAGARVTDWKGAHTPVLSFTLPGFSVEDAGEILQRSFGIVCRTGLHCAPLVHNTIGAGAEGTVRFSISRFTTDDEVDYALRAVRRMLA